MTNATLDAFTIELQRLYYLERELISALDTLTADVSIDTLDDLQETGCRKQLQDRLEIHRDETESHLDRLEEGFDAINEEPNARKTPELNGWIADKEQFNNVILNDKLRPLYYLSAAKKLEEIERSLYEPVLALANRLENEDEITGIVNSIEQTVTEEREMLDDLKALADSESVEMLLETSPVEPTNRSALDRSGVNIETLEDMFVCQLQNIYYIESAHTDLFEEMARDTAHTELGETITEQSDSTQTQIDRLEQVFEAVGPRVTDNQNHTFDGIVESRRNRLESISPESTALFDLETALTTTRVESRCYEELLALADQIGYPNDVGNVIDENLQEENETVQMLERIEFQDLIEESLLQS